MALTQEEQEQLDGLLKKQRIGELEDLQLELSAERSKYQAIDDIHSLDSMLAIFTSIGEVDGFTEQEQSLLNSFCNLGQLAYNRIQSKLTKISSSLAAAEEEYSSLTSTS